MSSLNGRAPEVTIYDEAPRPVGVSELRKFYRGWYAREILRLLPQLSVHDLQQAYLNSPEPITPDSPIIVPKGSP